MRGVLGALNYLAMKENSTIGLSDSTNIELTSQSRSLDKRESKTEMTEKHQQVRMLKKLLG